MSRAMIAVAKSKMAALLDGLHLDENEVVSVGLDLAIHHGRKAGLDRCGLHAMLDDALAAVAVEGGTAVSP